MLNAHTKVRAARTFSDPMVKLGEISPDGVKSVLMDDVGMSEGMATQQVQRYSFRAAGVMQEFVPARSK